MSRSHSTTGEFEEWGNPQDIEYDYMKSYSPYDNVKAQDYPQHPLVTTGLHDSRAQYWEPAKRVAKLRELKTDQRLLLLCTDMDPGTVVSRGGLNPTKASLEFALIGLAQGTLHSV